MGPATLDTDVERPWIRVAATRDADTAERWRAAVEQAGLAAEVHVEDAQEALPGTASVPQLMLGTGFAFGLWVPRDAREDSLRALIDGGWDGRQGVLDSSTDALSTRTLLGGALVALGAALAVVLLRALA